MTPSPVHDYMDAALAHLASRDFRPKNIVDVGASNGSWSIKASSYFHGVEFFLFEPLAEHTHYLEALFKADPRFRYFLTALGAAPGESTMFVSQDCDGSSVLFWEGQDSSRRRVIPVTTLDAMIESGQVQPPDLVKIDVQGFELEVLKGAGAALKSAQVFIVEVNLYEFMQHCPRVHEVIAFLAARDFYLYDLAGMLRRPYDNALGQMDLVFAAAWSPLANSNRWN